MRPIVIALLVGASAPAHDFITTKLTWSREVSRIFYRRCINCHRESGSAFALSKYDDARPWAQAIKEEVLARRMPPWSAIKGFGELKNDGGLTQEEIEIISDWVEGGAPKGEEKLLPPMPDPQEAEQSTARGGSLEVKGSLVLNRATLISGVRPLKLEEGASVKVVAERPDGSLIPLIWFYNNNPRFQRTYYFKKALSFPKGTTIRLTPSAGSVALIPTSGLKRGS
jgi:hypothetical protein